MYANINYNMSISQATYINAILLVKLSVCEFAFIFQLAKLTAHQI